MLLLGVQNLGTQTVLADGLINLGASYRKYCKKNNCGVATFSRTSNDITLQQAGVYHITATFVGTGETAGNVTVQMVINGVPVDDAISTETITTATTEFRTFVIDRYVLVDNDCILGRNSTIANSVSFINASDAIDATFTNVVVNVTKEV